MSARRWTCVLYAHITSLYRFRKGGRSGSQHMDLAVPQTFTISAMLFEYIQIDVCPKPEAKNHHRPSKPLRRSPISFGFGLTGYVCAKFTASDRMGRKNAIT